MKKRTAQILQLLEQQYGTDYVCYLHHENAFQLLIATMLSAQCTDARVIWSQRIYFKSIKP